MTGFIGWKTGVAIVVVLWAIAFSRYRTNRPLSPLVEISNGKLQGIESYTRGGRQTYEYLRIPFAKKPVGELRFEPPQSPEPWVGILDATELGPQCIQHNFVFGSVMGSEDCLYLNVYIPAERKGLLPVMLWIHGGAYSYGTANQYPPDYLLDEDVILVTTNYRLAALGFLNTGDDTVTGNQGLKDQNKALKWVQENIKSFGGDPTQVTLFGESAGSSSVGLHLISPMSKGLFARAIMQSGSPFAHRGLNREPAKQARHFAAKFNCTQKDTKAMIACLKKVDATTLVDAHKEMHYPISDKITLFVPTVEAVKNKNTFLGEEPLQIMKTGNFNKVPLIIGVNEHEGLLFSTVLINNQTKLNHMNDNWHSSASHMLGYDPSNTKASEQIRQFYFPQVTNISSRNFLSEYTNMLSDRNFFEPTDRFVKMFMSQAPVHMYLFSYSADFSLGDLMAASQTEKVPAIVGILWDGFARWATRTFLGKEIPHLGISHGDELQLLFYSPLYGYISESNKHFDMSRKMVKLWTTFAQNNDTLNVDNVKWPVVNEKSPKEPLKYFHLSNKIKVISDPYADRIQFWEKLNL